MAAIASRWLRRNVSQRLPTSGLFGARRSHRDTVVSDTLKPSFKSSPWMRGAPQVGFSATMRKISARISWLTRFRPPLCLAWESHLQYSRKPARCQPTTVLGCNHDERRFPSSPESSQHDPEQLVQRSEPMAGSFGVQSNQLLAEGQVFEDEILTRAESAQKPAEEMAERCDHAKNLTENRKSSLSPNL